MHALFSVVFLLCFQSAFLFFFLLIYLSVSMSFADFNKRGPSLKLTYSGVSSFVHAKTTRGFFLSLRKHRAGHDLDGDFLYSCLVCCYCCCVVLSRMMPSHSMDLPVPRGTSMLMLVG